MRELLLKFKKSLSSTKVNKSIKTILTILLIFFVSQSTLFADESSKTIKVGWILHDGLQNYNDGVISGYTYDYLMEISNYTNWNYEFEIGNLTDTLAKLKNGQLDIVGGLVVTDERLKTYEVSQNEYGRSYLSLFTRSDNSAAPYDYANFNGLKVALVENASANIESFKEFARKNNFTYELVYYPNTTDLSEAVINKEADAGVLGLYSARKETKTIAEFSPTPFYFCITKGKTNIVDELNDSMNKIKINHPYFETELYKKYFQVVKL